MRHQIICAWVQWKQLSLPTAIFPVLPATSYARTTVSTALLWLCDTFFFEIVVTHVTRSAYHSKRQLGEVLLGLAELPREVWFVCVSVDPHRTFEVSWTRFLDCSVGFGLGVTLGLPFKIIIYFGVYLFKCKHKIPTFFDETGTSISSA